ADVDWSARYGQRVQGALPSYPWQRERYWLPPIPRVVGGFDPLAGAVYETRWESAPVGEAQRDGDWQVVGEGARAIVDALGAQGQTASVVTTFSGTGFGIDLRPMAAGDQESTYVELLADLGRMAKGGGRVWWVTSGTSAPSTQVQARAGAILGLARVAAIEASAAFGGLVDVDVLDARLLVAHVRADDEDWVRFEDGKRQAARLVASARGRARKSMPIRADASYLITGGFGSLGRLVASRLADEGATELVLVGRSGASSQVAKDLVASLQKRGVSVRAVAADLSSLAGVKYALNSAENPVVGVVHAAGVTLDASLADQTADTLRAVFAPKLDAAWHLHQATQDLDFFTLFSSASGTLGVRGQANYAAANAGLDALARYRRSQGQPAMSVGWGPVGASQMVDALDDSVRKLWTREGVVAVDADHALDWWVNSLGASAAQLLVTPFNWAKYADSRPRPLSLLRGLAPQTVTESAGGWIADLSATPPGARHRALVDRLQTVVVGVLGYAADRRLDPKEGFFDAGLDSLMATELQARLEKRLGRSISATIAFEYPTLDKLATFLLSELDLGAQAQTVTRIRVANADEPIAIVGAACRFPAGANNLEAYWSLLERGVDGTSKVPADRFDVDAYFDAELATPGKLYTRFGGFLDEIDPFEPAFFGISPREAASLDPQQRMLLEVSWQALEHAAIAPDSLTDSLTGVYVGIGGSEYGRRFDPLALGGEADAYSGTGNESSFAAGRVSYALGLQGPAMSVNTACSSSLVTVHMACQALRAGDCNMALAGGVNAIVGPETTIQLSQLRALSPDGHCKAFDHRANGYVRGEGCGMIVLKRLSDALADGDRVLGLVRGSAVNHDGRSSGLTVPNGRSQQEVIRAALEDGAVAPDDVSMIECHGTGTPLGDPIEVGSLKAVLGQDRPQDRPLRMGSVKTNIGHLEAGAGIAGLLKVLLSLQHEQIPGHLHLEKLNPALPLSGWPVEIPTQLTPWPRSQTPRIGGISSFGISGTNAHILIEEAPAVATVEAVEMAQLITVSGKTDAGARALADALATALESGADLANTAFTVHVGRAALPVRIAVCGSDTVAVAAGLRSATPGEAVSEAPRLVFACGDVADGAIAQAQVLYGADPVFQAAIDAVIPAGEGAPALSGHVGAFAIQWALAQLLQSWGIVPDAVSAVGSGRYVAGCIAGGFDVQEGLRRLNDEPAPSVVLSTWLAETPVNLPVFDAMHPADGFDHCVDLLEIAGPGDPWAQLLLRVGQLNVAGVNVDWRGFHAHRKATKIDLPGTVFQRKTHWVSRPEDVGSQRLVGSDWVYGVDWIPLGDHKPSAAVGPTVVLCDGQGVGEAVAEALNAVRVRSGAGLAQDGDNWVVDPANADHLLQVMQAVKPARVVYLWALDADITTEPSAAAVDPCRGGLHLIQAATKHYVSELIWVTRGAQGWRNDSINLAHAPLWGLGQVAAIELVDTRVMRVDLAPGEADLPALIHLVQQGCVDDAVAVREGTAHVARLAHKQSPASISPAGTVWITGGMGALGLQIADWMLANGAARVVLGGRSVPSESAQAQIDTWNADVTRAVVVRGDVSDRTQVDAMLASIDGLDGAPLRGLVHAAGSLDDGSLSQLTWDRFETVWARKVQGGWNLHQALGQRALDFFVSFSSAASLIGSAGQANYGSANAFLDALADHRRSLGLAGGSLCWGPWDAAGLAVEANRSWSTGGVTPLSPSQGVAILGRLLSAGDAQVAVLDVDWDRFAAAQSRVPTLLSGLFESVEASSSSPLREALESAPENRRKDVLIGLVTESVAKVLGMDAGELDPDRGFFDAGLDSIMAVELSSHLKEGFGVSLSATVAFDYATVDALSTYLLAKVGPLEADAALAIDPIARYDEEPIAIVGMSCRFPGANSPEAFWAMLRDGVDPMRDVPAERWDLSEYYDPTPGVPGKMYVRQGGFVDNVDQFDPEFFGISPREAASMDPQQRMLLEVTWEALENAGHTTPSLKDSRTAVFIGVGDSGYLQRFQKPGEALYNNTYSGTGNLSAFVAGRVAYVLGLHGPNLSLNTACSSSLVATHLGVQALRAGECNMSLVGGVHLMLSPENFVYVSQLKALAADGRCKTFDASANGYGRSEGCGVLALRRLSDAQRDGDPILAVIRGSAVGHDGASSGLTVPSGAAQQEVIQDALNRSGVNPLDVSLIETHGTGTVLGDPIEVHAIETTYCDGRTAEQPLHLGAVKSNMGHAELAAGAASLVKLVLAMQHKTIPPILHFNQLNPDLDFEGPHLQVDTVATPWTPPNGVRRYAGVSGFGLSGTNAHLVLEEAPESAVQAMVTQDDRPQHLLTLSARDPKALRELAARYAGALQDGADLADLAFSAQQNRLPMPHRLSLVASDSRQALLRLTSFSATGNAPLCSDHHARARRPRVAFLFSGQGSQSTGMGRDLYKSHPVYRQAIDECAALLAPVLEQPLLDVLHGDGALIHDTAYTQPCLFALEYALSVLWKSWGVVPDVVVGHSIGELVACCVAGVFSLEDALSLVAERGRLMSALPREGGMVAVFAEGEIVDKAMGPYGDDVCVAALNNPGETVLSGKTDAILAVAAALGKQGIEHTVLKVSHAFHSSLMEPMLEAFEAKARTLTYSEPHTPVISNLTGTEEGLGFTDPMYWVRQVRQGVRFADCLRTLDEMNIDLFIEMGPHTTLLGMGRRTLSERDKAVWLPSLKRKATDRETLMSSAGAAWTRGVSVDFTAFDAPWKRRRVPLPNYPWQHRRIWCSDDEFPGRKPDGDRWLFAPTWSPLASTSMSSTGLWWVLGAGDRTEAIAAALTSSGATVEVHAEVESLPEALQGVVCTWALGSEDAVDTAWQVAQLAQKMSRSTASLVLLTEGAVDTGAGVSAPNQGAIWGLGRVVRLECPSLRVVQIDAETATGAAQIVAAALSTDDEPELCLRGAERLVARLHTAALSNQPPPLTGAVLITGGLGALGLEAAQMLLDKGSPKVILTSRSAPKDAVQHRIDAWNADGPRVLVSRGDVTIADDVTRILTDVDGLDVPLQGIMHAAGVLADGMLVNQDEAQFKTPFGPKVAGAWNLHQGTRGRSLDFFVLFSGGASLMGAPGQANYSAANAYLDAFASWRQQQGLPALSINWGAWADVGMAASLGKSHLERQASEGIYPLSLAGGMKTLGRMLGESGQMAVMNVDWPKFVSVFHKGVAPPFLRDFPTSQAAKDSSQGPVATESTQPELLQRLSKGGDRESIIGVFVEELVFNILDLDAKTQLDPDRPLLEVGLDSLLCVELKNGIADGGVDVPVARLMTGPSVLAVVQMVVQVLDAQAPVVVAPTVGVSLSGEASTPNIQTIVAPAAIHPVMVFFAGVVFASALIVGGYLVSLWANQAEYARLESLQEEVLHVAEEPPVVPSTKGGKKPAKRANGGKAR
ncbi:MAG: SDR family NAD(P)-dependent oxidoreductase, partial [Rhodobacterales bacterium]|nr:SDR family NAD(P)-dependent oxidoreductase [Rhodobacterales bacterium]